MGKDNVIEYSEEKALEVWNQHLREVKYSILDYPISVLVEKWEKKEIFRPEYQREFVWDKAKQTSFIETLLLGLPVPFLFGANTTTSKRHIELIDGVQRMSTITDFLQNKLKLQEKSLEQLAILKGKNFSKLPEEMQNEFKNTPIRLIKLDGTLTDGTPESNSIRLNIFQRVNTQGKILTTIEFINGTCPKTAEFLAKLKENKLFQTMCVKHMGENKKKRGESQELILRFLAYSNNIEKYQSKPMAFLINYASELNSELSKNDSELIKRLEIEFNMTLEFINKNNLSNEMRPLKKSKDSGVTRLKQVSRSRFEAIMIGAIRVLRDKPNMQIKPTIFENDVEYEALVKSDSANTKLIEKIDYVEKKFREFNE